VAIANSNGAVEVKISPDLPLQWEASPSLLGAFAAHGCLGMGEFERNLDTPGQAASAQFVFGKHV
jgi:hypothetical protein